MYGIFLALWVGISVAPDTLPIAILQNGTVTATAVGEATAVATSDGVTATRKITVTEQFPVVASVDVVIHKTTTGTDTVLVSSAIPLPHGRVTATTIEFIRLMVNGKEVPMFVEPLFGKHHDGSYKSILVQFPMHLTWGQNVTGQLEFGPRGIRKGTKTPVEWALLEPAIILPSSPSYIVSTGVLPPTVIVSEVPATPLNLEYEKIYAEWSQTHFSRAETRGDFNCNAPDACIGINFYDFVLASYVQWARTGNIEYWKRATILARVFTRGMLMYQPHNFQPDGLYYNYVLTGDMRSRQYLIAWAQSRVSWWTAPRVYEWSFGSYREGRQYQRVMLAALYAGLLEATDRNWLGLVDDYVKGWVDTQEPYFAFKQGTLAGIDYPVGFPVDGSWYYPLGSTGHGQSNYMEGLRITAMVTYLELRNPTLEMRQRTEQAIRKQADFLWNTQWQSQLTAFHYWTTWEWQTISDAERKNYRELNNMMTIAFAYTYHVTGDPVYRDRAMQSFSVAWVSPDGWKPWWTGHNGKIFNQNYYSSPRVFYYLTFVR